MISLSIIWDRSSVISWLKSDVEKQWHQSEGKQDWRQSWTRSKPEQLMMDLIFLSATVQPLIDSSFHKLICISRSCIRFLLGHLTFEVNWVKLYRCIDFHVLSTSMHFYVFIRNIYCISSYIFLFELKLNTFESLSRLLKPSHSRKYIIGHDSTFWETSRFPDFTNVTAAYTSSVSSRIAPYIIRTNTPVLRSHVVRWRTIVNGAFFSCKRPYTKPYTLVYTRIRTEYSSNWDALTVFL